MACTIIIISITSGAHDNHHYHNNFCGRPKSDGVYLVASLKYHVPRVCTPLAHRALKGWDRLEPAQPREPLPWICVAAIAVELLLMQQPLAALATLLMFTMYLRPMEFLESTIDQWTPPTSHLGGVFQFWVFTVRPVTSGKPAKNRLFDQSIALDRPELAWISEILVLLCQQKPQAQMLAPV